MDFRRWLGALALLGVAVGSVRAVPVRGQASESVSRGHGPGRPAGKGELTVAAGEPGEPSQGPDWTQPTEVMVVTASRREEPSRSSVVAAEAIGRRAIERSGARNVAELLQERAGLQLDRSYRGSALSLRGLSSEYTLVLVNGDRVPGLIGGAVDLSRYGIENVERVEIVRGPASALYGADALGGVVNIITRQPVGDLEADALLSAGQNGALDLTSRVAGRITSTTSMQVTAGAHRAAAFGGDGVSTRGSARRQWSTGLSVGYRPGPSYRVRVQLDYIQLRLEGVDTGAGTAVFDRTQLQEQFVAGLEQHVRLSDSIRLLGRARYSEFREQYLLDQRNGKTLDKDEDNRERLAQGTQLLHWQPSDDHQVSVGVEGLAQQLDTPRIQGRGRRVRLSGFVQDEWRLFERGSTTLRVAPGLRLDVDSQFGSQLSPKLALRLDMGPDSVVRVSYGRGFRAPSFKELLLRFENPTAGYAVTGNPKLKAERSHGLDLGAEWWPREEWKLRSNVFVNQLDDMIAVVTVAEGTATGRQFSYRNVRSAWTAGVESLAELRLARVLDLRLGHMLLYTRDVDDSRRLEGRPTHRITVGPRLRYPAWRTELVARAAALVGRVYYQDTNMDGTEEELGAPTLTQLDMRLQTQWGQMLELALGVDNLLGAGDRYTLLRPRTLYVAVRGRI